MQGKMGLILRYAAFSNLAIKRCKILEEAQKHTEVVQVLGCISFLRSTVFNNLYRKELPV
jgi:hypothetical protein